MIARSWIGSGDYFGTPERIYAPHNPLRLPDTSEFIAGGNDINLGFTLTDWTAFAFAPYYEIEWSYDDTYLGSPRTISHSSDVFDYADAFDTETTSFPTIWAGQYYSGSAEWPSIATTKEYTRKQSDSQDDRLRERVRSYTWDGTTETGGAYSTEPMYHLEFETTFSGFGASWNIGFRSGGAQTAFYQDPTTRLFYPRQSCSIGSASTNSSFGPTVAGALTIKYDDAGNTIATCPLYGSGMTANITITAWLVHP